MRRLQTPIALTAIVVSLVPLGGCGSIDPFDRGRSEPLPPVTGNVIATSSNRELRASEELEEAQAAEQDALSQDQAGAADADSGEAGAQ
ncbi:MULTISPECIES: hypothetical protein [unclassified Roseitalea]|uniref:hypothetical protein n=1 Tax=unclassified Roseitalea TaxID=2639107 RepID=UPI00273EB1AC|nr:MULTISPECIES: hypothetical protein [unclassified Roseitalea]